MPGRCFCPARPWCRKACLPEDGAMRYAADPSVLLSWWKLLDARRDSRGPRRLAAPKRPCYSIAGAIAAPRPGILRSMPHSARSCPGSGARGRKSPSIDLHADAFASLLRDCAAHYDGRERRPEQLLLYHVGRYLYLADALRTCRAMCGQVRITRFATATARTAGRSIRRTGHSCSKRSTPPSAWPARPWSCWTGGATEALSTSYISGLPAVIHAVAEGTFPRRETGGKT